MTRIGHIRRVTERVSYEEAVTRLVAWHEKDHVTNKGNGWSHAASGIADIIWPGHSMHSQGAGWAASKFIRRMLAEGVLCNARPPDWGFIITGS